MTVSFHKYGEFFPGTGELRVGDRATVYVRVSEEIRFRISVSERENTMP